MNIKHLFAPSINLTLIVLVSHLLFACGQVEKSPDVKGDEGVSDTASVVEDGERVIVAAPNVERSEIAINTGDYIASLVPKEMTVQEKKARFRALLVPPTQKVYRELQAQYEAVSEKVKSGKSPEEIAKLKTAYRAESDEELLAALKPHPPSIVLAQAAMESAWGTSRFFVKANNVFGVWSFDSNEPRIAASEQRGDKTIWLKKYASVEDSVRDNYRVLARGDAFKAFRKLRMQTENPYELVKKLDKYSEKGDEYGKELTSMISFNKFAKYDDTFFERKR